MPIKIRFPFLSPEGEPAGGAPAPVAATAAAVPVAAAPAADPSDLPAVGEPGWVKARADRAADKAKKELRRELKTERRAVEQAGNEAKATAASAAADVAAAKMAVDAILSQVPEAERAALIKAGGSSITDTLKAFSVWQATRAASPVAAVPAVAVAPAAPAAAAAAPPPAPAHTAAPAAPAPAGVQSQQSVAEQYSALRKVTDPTQRAAMSMFFVLDHEGELLESASKR